MSAPGPTAAAPWAGVLADGAGTELAGAALRDAVETAVSALQPLAREGAPLGLLADNGLPWAVADLAALELGLTLVPLPGFFTDAQLRHVLRAARLGAVLTDDPARAAALIGGHAARVPSATGLTLVTVPGAARAHTEETPPGGPRAARVTFTSGTTGEPKGVALAAGTLLGTAAALARASGIGREDVHVALLPLAILLENVGGLYRGLLGGARVVLPPLARVGLAGSSSQRADALVQVLAEHGATTAILVPQTLACLVEALERGASLPRLRFLGVGGAPLPAPLLERARQLGVPVFEGYGLSETGSVVALNTPAAARPGSVGRPLPHARVRIADDGEVLVRGPALLGYVGGEPSPLRADGWLATGDLGSLDADGFLTLHGRKRSVLRTAYGRKVSPEWVERELLASPCLVEAIVLGDGLPQPRAVLVPAEGRGPRDADDVRRQAAQAVDAANARLPDYARVDRWRFAREPFTPANGQRSAAGRLRRDAIAAAYADFLAADPPPALLPEFPAVPSPPPFHELLQQQTAPLQEELFSIPFVRSAVRGELDLPTYLSFLGQAYHHVRQTVPLLMAVGARLDERHAWLRDAVAHYIAEESGHHLWILDDIAACGGDPAAVAAARPGLPCELMVAYAWDTVQRGNPVGFFGMVQVLEGVSARGATGAAASLQRSLGLPDGAVRYLSSHGTLDQQHVAFFESLMDRLDDPADRDAVLHGTRVFYRLYGDIFRALPADRAPLGACA